MEDEGFDARLLGLLVEGVTDDAAAEAALDLIRRATGGIGYTSIIHRRGGPPPLVATSFDPDALAGYAAHYWQTDLWAQAGATGNRMNATSHGDELVDRAVFERSEFYNDFLRPRGIHHLLTAATPLPGGFVSHGVFGGKDRAFTEADRRRLDGFRTLVSAMLAGRLALQLLRTENALLASGSGGPWRCVVDAEGRIVMAAGDPPPEIAEHAARAAHVAELTSPPMRALQADINAVATRAVPARSRMIRIAGTAFLAEVLPGPRGAAALGELAVAILVLRADEASRRLRKLHDWAARHGLTPAETALATAIGQGRTLADYADGRGVALATARSQLASIFGKTGLRKQTALAAHLARLLAA